jgi:transposase-like protein
MAILRRHLVEKVPVSQLCEEHGIQPGHLYGWQKALFENGASVFDGSRKRNGRQEEAATQRMEALTAKLRRKDEVLSELMAEHVALKKSLGES